MTKKPDIKGTFYCEDCEKVHDGTKDMFMDWCGHLFCDRKCFDNSKRYRSFDIFMMQEMQDGIRKAEIDEIKEIKANKTNKTKIKKTGKGNKMNNEVNLIGNLSLDVELKEGKTKKYMNNLVATTNSYKDKETGEWKKKKTKFIPFTLWDKYAEKMSGILKKGDLVEIKGELDIKKVEAEGHTINIMELKVNSIVKKDLKKDDK